MGLRHEAWCLVGWGLHNVSCLSSSLPLLPGREGVDSIARSASHSSDPRCLLAQVYLLPSDHSSGHIYTKSANIQ